MDSCTLYLDASGDQGWHTPYGNSKTQWYVLSGITLTPDTDLKAKEQISKLMDQYSPIKKRSQFESKYHELHYNAIYCGQNIFSHLDFGKRVELIDKVFKLICELNPIIMSISINKDQLYNLYTTPDNPKLLSIRSVVSKFSMYLKRKNLAGSIVYDSEEYHKDVQLRALMHRFRSSGAERRGMEHQPFFTDKLENVLNTINLCPSEMSSGIQLADFCAKALWLHREKSISARFNQIEQLYENDSASGRKFPDTIFPNTSKWI